jgi:hypothetical protein
MSDNTAPPPGIPTPASPSETTARSGARLTLAEQAAGIATLRKAGMSEAKIADAMAGKPQLVKPERERGADPTARSGVPMGDAKKMADGLLAAGVPAERVKEALAADGYDTAELQEDPRSEEELEWDKSTLGAAQSPNAYRIAWPQHSAGIPAGDPEIAAALDKHVLDEAGIQLGLQTAIREGLQAMNWPPLIGGSIIEEAMDDAYRYSRMSEAERALWDRQQLADLAKIVPNGDANEAIANGKTLLSLWRDQSEQSRKFVDALTNRGWLRSAYVVAQFDAQARRVLRRGELANSRKS